MDYTRIVVGIDIGLSGAIAAVGDNGTLIGVWDMPLEAHITPGKMRTNAAKLYAILCEIRALGVPVLVRIEFVAAMPKQGVTSMFSFGDSMGCVRTAVAISGLPHVFVTPKDWKGKAGMHGKDKDYARTRVKQLYSTAPVDRVKDGGRADAILIGFTGL